MRCRFLGGLRGDGGSDIEFAGGCMEASLLGLGVSEVCGLVLVLDGDFPLDCDASEFTFDFEDVAVAVFGV